MTNQSNKISSTSTDLRDVKVATPTTANETVSVPGSSSAKDDVNWNDLNKTKYFISSTLFVLMAESAAYPFDLLKTRQQYVRSLNPSAASLRFQAATLYRKEGLRGFFRGYGMTMLGNIPGQAMYFGGYEFTKTMIVKHLFPMEGNVGMDYKQTTCDDYCSRIDNSTSSSDDGDDDFAHLSTPKRVIANLTAGFAAEAFCLLAHTPFDNVAQRLVVAGQDARPPPASVNGTFHFYKVGLQDKRTSVHRVVSNIFRYEGIKGLYRGYWASVASTSPGSAIWFTVYELCKFHMPTFVAGDGQPNSTRARQVGVHLLSGAAAGAVSTLAMNPFDVAKTRYQTLNAAKPQENALIQRGFLNLLRVTFQQEGLLGVYRGLTPRLILAVPFSAITFAAYEAAKHVSRAS
eukprot:m.246262 g.246262  ORF g.246262 m.246262 type:complete len:403 (+) comp15376_c0_seq2:2048-3256(+)